MTDDALLLLDTDRLSAWLDAEELEPGLPIEAAKLSGGSSNAMFLVRRGNRTWVLRRPAKVAVANADEGMRREFRVLQALEGTNVPHPGPVALCDDHRVLGRTFYLMEHVPGVAALPVPPALNDDRGRAELSFAMVDALARLHDVDWRAAGLADLGRPHGFHERQVHRWSSQLSSYEGRALPGIEEVMTWLQGHLPESFTPAIMHGDFHMMNVLIARDGPGRVLAILDWETTTIGDPLLDLAGFCEIWCSVAPDGFPGREALIERYATVRRLGDPDDLAYYNVLYNFRMAVLLEGIYQRSLLDPTRATQEVVGERVLFNLRRAVELTQAGM